jgi:serine O-acetyltransferase
MIDRLTAMSWHAVRMHRLAHRLQLRGHASAARVVCTLNRVLTGVEIEPGAVFGKGLTIMHGSGIVVNDTSEVGTDCIIYQQVTLGGDAHDRTGTRPPSRGPRIGDRVTLYAGAKIIGPVTVGDDSVVAANAVVLDDVPAGHTAVGVPARMLPPAGR